MIDVEKNLRKDISNLDNKIDSVKNELTTNTDNVEKNLQKDISGLSFKIDVIDKNLNLNNKIDSVKNELTTKIDNVEKRLNEKLSTGNRLIHFMILAAAIFGPILNALFMKYLQYIK